MFSQHVLLFIFLIRVCTCEEQDYFITPELKRAAVAEHKEVDGSNVLVQFKEKKEQSTDWKEIQETLFDDNGRWLKLSKYTDSGECANKTNAERYYERTGVCIRVRGSDQIQSALVTCGIAKNEIQRFYFSDKKCQDYIADEPLPTDSCAYSEGPTTSKCIKNLEWADQGMGLLSTIYQKKDHAKKNYPLKRAVRIEGPRHTEVFGCHPYTRFPDQALSMKFSCKSLNQLQVEFFKQPKCAGSIVKQKTLDYYPIEKLGPQTYHAVTCRNYQREWNYRGIGDHISVYAS